MKKEDNSVHTLHIWHGTAFSFLISYQPVSIFILNVRRLQETRTGRKLMCSQAKETYRFTMSLELDI